MTDRRRFAVSVLNNILGGGMSSRLFQNIRERQGLAYAIFSEMSSYRDAGMLSVYAGTSLETAAQVVRSVLEEFRRLKDEPLDAEEMRRAKDHLKGATLLALESSGQRMTSLARYHIYFNRHFTPDELIGKHFATVIAPESLAEVGGQFEAMQADPHVERQLRELQLRRDGTPMAAEIRKPAQTTAKLRIDQRAGGPHSRYATAANASVATETVATASARIPNTIARG